MNEKAGLNDGQKTVLSIGIAIGALMLLYPPWVEAPELMSVGDTILRYGPDREVVPHYAPKPGSPLGQNMAAGYSFIFDPPPKKYHRFTEMRIAWVRLLIQWAALAGVTGLGVSVLKEGKPTIPLVSPQQSSSRQSTSTPAHILKEPVELHRFVGHQDVVWTVSFSPNGRRILSGSVDDTVRIWDIASGQNIQTFQGRLGQFSPDGQYVLVGGTDLLQLYKADSGEPVRKFRPQDLLEFRVKYLAFSPEGSRFVSVIQEKTTFQNYFSKWNVNSEKDENSFPIGFAFRESPVVLSPLGRFVTTGHEDGTIRVWDTNSDKEVRCFDAYDGRRILRLTFSPDGLRILSANCYDKIRLWNVERGKELYLSDSSLRETDLMDLAFSPSGQHFAWAGGWNGSSKLYSQRENGVFGVRNLKGINALISYRGHPGRVNSIAFSPDGYCLLTGSSDMTIRLWKVAT